MTDVQSCEEPCFPLRSHSGGAVFAPIVDFTMMESHPSRSQLLSAETAFRKPRYDNKGKPDSPENEFVSGQVYVALGVAAIVFAGRSMNRVRTELAIIQEMWSKNTTLYESKKKQGLNTLARYRPRQGYPDGAWPPSDLGGVESSGAKAINWKH